MRVAGRVARALLGVPRPLVGRLAGVPVVRDGFTLDAQSQLALRLARLAGRDSKLEQSLAHARAELEEMALALAPRADIARVEAVTLAVPGRVYLPRAPTGAALVFLHGGGWT